MTTEFAGAVDLDPPLTASEIAYVRRLAGTSDLALMSWAPARDGSRLRPRAGADIDSCLESMRYLIATMERPGRFRGMVAAYDTDAGELAALTVSRGRVTRRVLRAAPPSSGGRSRPTVIDFASRRRAMARDILA
jgi:hypothetical protein